MVFGVVTRASVVRVVVVEALFGVAGGGVGWVGGGDGTVNGAGCVASVVGIGAVVGVVGGGGGGTLRCAVVVVVGRGRTVVGVGMVGEMVVVAGGGGVVVVGCGRANHSVDRTSASIIVSDGYPELVSECKSRGCCGSGAATAGFWYGTKGSGGCCGRVRG